MSKAPPTQPSPGRAPVFGLITPEDWYRIPLQPRERREASVNALIRRQFTGVDDQPILRRKAEEQLLGTAEAGAEQGGVVLYLSFLEVGGIPLSASLLVSRLHRKFDGLDAVAALAGSGEVELMTLPAAGRAARLVRRERSKQSRKMGSEFADTVVEYFVPVPDRDEVLMLTFSTPLEPIADAMVGLFDAVAGTLRWQKADNAGNGVEGKGVEGNGEEAAGWASD
ncbi:hypothetical protein GCM10023084_33890 [Streptomyces lacrimifluminis]|uniref:Uncharacterized protein n=1 Tax=Streptomyces lacrimifluminis TaxID=1500077 RepID=A0A917NWA2_9ACTN|nr:hypothetical protein [Streptomyces lacrimifluminis]GGJ31235.1 hypothetical protein GCM10012282_29800 [Streptomyces lacrimifluminis]